MTQNPIIANLIHLMNKVCQLKEAGANVVYEECPTDLSWIWRNQDTDRVIDTVKLSQIKPLIFTRKTDPRIKYLIAFICGGPARELLAEINKLEKLKAFW